MAAGRSHYETLGVARDATAAEVRAAYLALARQHHPDRHSGADRVSAERRMQRINAAWTVLGDPARRDDYDRTLRAPRADPGPASGFRATGHGRVEFTPLDDTEYGRSTEEHPYRRSRAVPRWATMTPFGLFALALVTLFGGVILNSRGVMGLGVVVLAVSAVAFFVIPLLALSAAERDRR